MRLFSWSGNLNVCSLSKIIFSLRFNYQVSQGINGGSVVNIKNNN